MAALQNRNGSYRILFEFRGKQRAFTVGRVAEAEARAKAAQVDYLLLRLKQGLIELPPGVEIVEFLKADARPPKPDAPAPGREALGLAAFRGRYLETHRASLEPRTVEGIELHFKHLVAALGASFPVAGLKLADLQGYVDRRARAKGIGGRPLSAATIKKEIVSLRTAWNWGAKMGLMAGKFPSDGLRYPKLAEKPPFQTRAEIERQIASGGLSKAQIRELWAALYLQSDEMDAALAHIRENARHGWIHPMAATAAFTGARRSELIRMRVTDVDFAARLVTIREKKRVRGKATTRRVPLSKRLAAILREYLEAHPGGHVLFRHGEVVGHSKKRSATTGHRPQGKRPKSQKARDAAVRERPAAEAGELTKDEAHDHLRRALKGSGWEIVKGWHVWRHSFVSACATRGVDQRLLQSWCGHMTAEMSARYAHLYPGTQQSVLDAVFD